MCSVVGMSGPNTVRRIVSKWREKGAAKNRGRHMILRDESNGGGTGFIGVAVKCVDIERNTGGEGGFVDIN